jgi:hypothetical protein
MLPEKRSILMMYKQKGEEINIDFQVLESTILQMTSYDFDSLS